MKAVFNDLSEITVQSATIESGYLQIKTISATAAELREKFEDSLATRVIKIVERGQTISEFVGYTTLYRVEDYGAGILGVAMYKPAETPEAQAEVQAAAMVVARYNAQALPDALALEAKVIYPEWDGNGVIYPKGYKAIRLDTLYKCLTGHTSQENWTPENSPSLWSKVLISDPGDKPEWEKPESTNGYSIGDKVTHNFKTWESLVDNNVWEPGVVGTEAQWREVAE